MPKDVTLKVEVDGKTIYNRKVAPTSNITCPISSNKEIVYVYVYIDEELAKQPYVEVNLNKISNESNIINIK